ncbi:MAG: hypothetical protein R2835_00515 [Thermomicrobiales bacterium]
MASPAREATGKKHQKKPASITEVIAAAADVVIARPLLMIAPVLLDCYYLLGWRITPGSTFDHLRSELMSRGTSSGDWISEQLGKASSVDLTGLAAFAVPSLFPDTNDKVYRPFARTAIALDNWGALMLAAVVMIGVSMFLFGFVGLWLADSGLNRTRTWDERARLGPVVGGRFLLMALLVAAMLLMLLAPFLFAMVVASGAEVSLESLVVSVGVLGFLALYVLFYFAPDSLLIDLAGPVQALRASSSVVRRNFGVTVLFVIVSIFISIGLADVWDRLATNAPGLAIAIVANAFVGCVLWIASLLFYSERSQVLASERAAPTGLRSTT